MKHLITIALAGLVLTVSACSKKSDGNGDGTSISAELEGTKVAVTKSEFLFASYNPPATTGSTKGYSYAKIRGWEGEKFLEVIIYYKNKLVPGTYSMKKNADKFSPVVLSFTAHNSLPIKENKFYMSWGIDDAVQDGVVTITRADDKVIEGTYTGKVKNQAEEVKTVTSGKFNLKLFEE